MNEVLVKKTGSFSTKALAVVVVLVLVSGLLQARAEGGGTQVIPALEAFFWALLSVFMFVSLLVFVLTRPADKKKASKEAKAPQAWADVLLEKVNIEQVKDLKQAGGKFVKNDKGEVEAFISVLKFEQPRKPEK